MTQPIAAEPVWTGLWVAHWDGGRATRFRTDGQPDRYIPLPVSRVTSVAFFGADLDRMAITTAAIGRDEEPLAGALFVADASVRGLPPATYGRGERRSPLSPNSTNGGYAIMKRKAAAGLLATVGLAALMSAAAAADKLVIGFAQVGSESGWRSAETKVAKADAAKAGVDLRISDAQQKQENEIKAVRAFIAQGVDAIFLAPVVATGWDPVLKEAKEARIPVVLLDRAIDTKDQSLYLTAVTSDTVAEGRIAGEWLIKAVNGKPCNVVELQGTVGSSPAINRKKGFDEAIAKAPNIKIVRSQTGDFTRAKGKEVMESFLKAEGGKNICAVYAHNDDMQIGAIQAIKEAGLRPGKDILLVSIDGVPDLFKAMADGEANATVELDPNMAGPAIDAVKAYKTNGTLPPKWIQTPSKLYTPDTAAAEYARRKEMY